MPSKDSIMLPSQPRLHVWGSQGALSFFSLEWAASNSEFIAEVCCKLRNYLERIEFPSASQQLPGCQGHLNHPTPAGLRWRGGKVRPDQPGLGPHGQRGRKQRFTQAFNLD